MTKKSFKLNKQKEQMKKVKSMFERNDLFSLNPFGNIHLVQSLEKL